jgi:hypothetical protein
VSPVRYKSFISQRTAFCIVTSSLTLKGRDYYRDVRVQSASGYINGPIAIARASLFMPMVSARPLLVSAYGTGDR